MYKNSELLRNGRKHRKRDYWRMKRTRSVADCSDGYICIAYHQIQAYSTKQGTHIPQSRPQHQVERH